MRTPPAGRRPAVFLDRDGTLLDELGYLADPTRLRLFPGAADAVRRIGAAGFAVVVVTNQSGVARGLLDEPTLAAVHAELERRLAREGAILAGIYCCPHHPTEGEAPWRRDCECRKPRPGLLLAAARQLDLDLSRSWLVGDALRDLEAGRRAGVGHLVLVGTGKGGNEREAAEAAEGLRFTYEPDLSAAADGILAATGGAGDQGR